MAKEMLGIMVTRYEDLDHIAGVMKAAQAAGHPITLLLTDEGVRFTLDPSFIALLKLTGLEVFACEHVCDLLGIHDKTAGITYGSQYNNATMLHESARVLVF